MKQKTKNNDRNATSAVDAEFYFRRSFSEDL